MWSALREDVEEDGLGKTEHTRRRQQVCGDGEREACVCGRQRPPVAAAHRPAFVHIPHPLTPSSTPPHTRPCSPPARPRAALPRPAAAPCWRPPRPSRCARGARREEWWLVAVDARRACLRVHNFPQCLDRTVGGARGGRTGPERRWRSGSASRGARQRDESLDQTATSPFSPPHNHCPPTIASDSVSWAAESGALHGGDSCRVCRPCFPFPFPSPAACPNWPPPAWLPPCWWLLLLALFWRRPKPPWPRARATCCKS